MELTSDPPDRDKYGSGKATKDSLLAEADVGMHFKTGNRARFKHYSVAYLGRSFKSSRCLWSANLASVWGGGCVAVWF